MDGSILGVLIGIVKAIPDSKIVQAEAAADRAEDARDEALAKSYGIIVQGTSLMITETTEGGGE